MGKRGTLAAAAAACWGGTLAITVTSLLGYGVREPGSVALSRLDCLLLTLAAVLSVAWAMGGHVIAPRAVFRLGMELGERREQARQAQAIVQPLHPEARNGHRSPAKPR